MDGVVELIEVTQTKADAYITSCGARGRTGPSEEQCKSAYAGSTTLSLIQSVVAGIQTIVIPLKGTYTFTAYGARGGNARLDSPDYRGGKGAKVWGTFALEKGDKVRVVVGQSGSARDPAQTENNPQTTGGAGGGGTFIWLNNEATPLLVAGGGGGASYVSGLPQYWGTDGQASESGLGAFPNGGQGGRDGHGGNGPFNSNDNNGGAGAGWYTGGLCVYQTFYCGFGRANGFEGGYAFGGGTAGYFPGGFGGGGGTRYEGGGGGGYSGGGGGLHSGSGGGGGGSFIDRQRATSSGWVTGGNKDYGEGLVIMEAPCPYGKKLLDSVCVPIDACAETPCPKFSTCKDLEDGPADASGRTCTCDQGYEMDEEMMLCVDIDACAKHPCPDDNAACIDKPAPALGTMTDRTCDCAEGYDFQDEQCVDIDACKVAPCDGASKCIDLPGLPADENGRECSCLGATSGENCSCPAGYDIDDSFNCLAIDACMTSKCPGTNVTCIDKPVPAGAGEDGRTCICEPGFVESPPNSVCVDLDACQGSPCGANTRCVDRPAPSPGGPDGRRCECLTGFQPSPDDDDSCVEINPCLTNNGFCDANAVCTDKPGSVPGAEGRVCTCNTGFVGNGEVCTDIDACADTTCPGQNTICVDKPPPALDGATGRDCVCAPGYTSKGDGNGDCEDIDSCINFGCRTGVICLDLPGTPEGKDGRTCTCSEGLAFDSVTETCVDADACFHAPCMPNSACTDLPPPAASDASGRMWYVAM